MRFPLLHKLDCHMREMARGASVAFSMKVLGAGFSFAFSVFLARVLGAEGTGIYYLALSLTSIGAVFGRMGLDNTLLRYTAANASVGDWQKVKGIYKKGMTLAVISSITAGTVMCASASGISQTVFSKPELTDPLRWMSLAVIPMVFVNLHAEMLKGLKRIGESQFLQGVGIPALSLAGFYLFGRFLGLKGAVLTYIWAALVITLLGIWLWRRAAPQLRGTGGHFGTHELLRSSMPLFWVAFMNLLMSWAGTFMLGIWGTNSDVNIFNVAARTAMLTSFILLGVNSIAAPKFAALYMQGDMQTLGKTACDSAGMMTLAAVPILLVFIITPESVLSIFGNEFRSGAIVLMILTLGQFVNVATGSVGYLLIMSGHERLMRNNVFGCTLLNITLNAIYIPKYGIVGAAIGASTSMVCLNLISTALVRRYLNVTVLPFFQVKLANGK